MSETKRIFYYDVLRAIAIIGIVFCHASVAFVAKVNSLSYGSFYISAFFDCFREFSIPVFVMLSGALLLGRKDTLMKFFKKRLSRLFIPFVFWVIVYGIYSYFYLSGNLNDVWNIFLGTSGTLGVAFWFIWMIVICYFGIFIINKIIEWNSGNDAFNRYFMPILVILAVSYFFIYPFNPLGILGPKLAYFISFMSYVVIGYGLANFNLLGSRFKNDNLISVAAGLLFLISYVYYVSFKVVPSSISSGHFSYSSYFNFLILFMSVNFFLFFKYLSKTEFLKSLGEKTFGGIMTQISEYSFGIYLVHYLILYILKVNLVRYVNFTSQSPLFWIPFLVSITLLISMVILTVLNKVPVIGSVSGKG